MYPFINMGPFWKTHGNDAHLFLIKLLINESSLAMFFWCLRLPQMSTMKTWLKFRVKVLCYHHLQIIFSKIASYEARTEAKVLFCDKIRYNRINKMCLISKGPWKLFSLMRKKTIRESFCFWRRCLCLSYSSRFARYFQKYWSGFFDKSLLATYII